MQITFEHCQKAFPLVQKYVDPSPLVKNEWLSQKYKAHVFLKLENLTPVGSFKLRGATHKLFHMPEEQKKKGVIAISAGNHAQGVAWACSQFGVKSKIIMPHGSPLTKIRNTQALGAEVELYGDSIEDCLVRANELIETHDYTLVHPFEDPEIIAGQASVGFEILSQQKKIDYLFTSIGGGGLAAGLGLVFQKLSPKTKLIASQAKGASSMAQSLEQKKALNVEDHPTFADGIRVKTVSLPMYNVLKDLNFHPIILDDGKIALSVLELMESARVIAEGAAAINLAALDELYQKDPKQIEDKNIVLVICGGNIDTTIVDRIIEKGMIAGKRQTKIRVHVPDKPGSLEKLTDIFYECQANIIHIDHVREALDISLAETKIYTVLEVHDEDHGHRIVEELEKHFDSVRQLY